VQGFCEEIPHDLNHELNQALDIEIFWHYKEKAKGASISERFGMVRKRKLIYIAFAIILVFLIIGITPLNLAHKLSSGCLFAKSKPVLKGGASLRYSLPPQNDMNAVILPSSVPGNQMVQLWDSALSNPGIIPSDSPLKPIPMRC